MSHAVRVASAHQASEWDSAVIGAGTPSRALMQRAGAAGAAEIAARYGHLLAGGVTAYAGPGNNGGDTYVVARALAATGVRVAAIPVLEARSADAKAERALVPPTVQSEPIVGARVVIDGLLGTGAQGEPRGAIADAIRQINRERDAGAVVAALDIPSGLDATTGEATLAVSADLTLTFGSVKRGLLIDRARSGRIVVLDIGLGDPGESSDSAALVDERWVRAALPAITASAHKGTRKKLVIIGGAPGMAGAAVLAARAAMRSGIGMVRLIVARESLPVVQVAAHQATARPWEVAEGGELDEAVTEWADAMLLGPGMGDTPRSRALVERLLASWRGPVVLDADALNVFKGEAEALGSLFDGRPALITPHAGEFARLAGRQTAEVLACRFDIGRELARQVRGAVLLKGVPTVVSDLDGGCLVSAAGTPALAAAGSGDLLAGIAATLLAQMSHALQAGACAAWVHGRAAELAGEEAGRVGVRGVTLDDIEAAIPRVWSAAREPLFRYPVLAELPPVA